MSINIITEPKVRLVGRLSIDQEELNGFLADEGAESWTTDTDDAASKLVEVSGRLCYKSYAKPRPGGNSAYIGHILEVGHGSVVEHACYNFIITGVSRSFTHELVRHRAGWAYSQRSQRFVSEEDCSFVVPAALQSEVAQAQAFIEREELDDAVEALNRCWVQPGNWNDENRALMAGLRWLASVDRAAEDYGKLVEYLFRRDNPGFRFPSPIPTDRRKKAREAARSVLPNATETQIFVTANARALRHFLEARGDASADAEIRAVALKMLAILQADSPNLFGDYRVEKNADGIECITTDYRKV